jgi:hypothetical protein
MKFCPVVPEICRGQVHGPRKERKRRRIKIKIKIIIIIIRNGTKTIRLQTLFGRLNKITKCFSKATTAAVISLGFDSMEAISLISPEDLAKSKITVGKIKMLLKAVKQTSLSEDATMAEDTSDLGHTQPDLPVIM